MHAEFFEILTPFEKQLSPLVHLREPLHLHATFTAPCRKSFCFQEHLNPPLVVNVSQLLTLDKSFLVEKSKRLSEKKIVRLNEGLKLVLAIS